MPEISVIVPVYNAEEYLADCVESLLSQTFSDFEVILVDDGSPDHSGSLCDGYAAKYDHIFAIHQENRGQSAARNHAMTLARGQWICFVDSDDLIHPLMLELLYRAARDSGAAIAMCGMLEELTLPEEFHRERDPVFDTLPMDEETLLRLYDAGEYPGWVACAKLIRKELIVHYPFREGRVYEDNEAVCRWICEAGSLVRTKEQLYFYRGNPDSTTKGEFKIKRLDYLWALESIIGHYTALGYQQMRQRFVERYLEAVVDCCNGVRYMLFQPKLSKGIEKQVRSFLRREKISLTKPQFEALLEVMHPEIMWLYWPVAGAAATLWQQGLAGLLKKIRKQLGRGDDL